MTLTNDLRFALRKRCAPPAWALFEEVRDRQGHDSKRSADAIAMSLYKSRGYEVHGFELKISRGDWLKELKRPEKDQSLRDDWERHLTWASQQTMHAAKETKRLLDAFRALPIPPPPKVIR